MGGDCKTPCVLVCPAHIGCFSAIAPWEGTASLHAHPHAHRTLYVSAPSPHGRGLQVNILAVEDVNTKRFSAIAPWEGTASSTNRDARGTRLNFTPPPPLEGAFRFSNAQSACYLVDVSA